MNEQTPLIDARVIEYQARAARLAPEPLALVQTKRHAPKPSDAVKPCIVDLCIEDSFPASDPPSWNSGIAVPVSPKAAEASGRNRIVSTVRTALRRVAAFF